MPDEMGSAVPKQGKELPISASPLEHDHPRHRGDIQGLRAIAVAAVVAYHAGVKALGGGFVGVDLFFVLSGFLITDLLVREWAGTGRINLPRFWARRARRLLPASTIVLVATAIASATLMPVLRRGEIARDIEWSALFAANWRFADQQTDYSASDRAISPVLHYWSLGVEEQFYLVWPALVIICGLLAYAAARVRGLGSGAPIRLAVGVVAAAVVVMSFGFELKETVANQPYAYFGTPARAWQLGVGALLASCLPLLSRMHVSARTVLAIGGLVGLATGMVVLRDTGGETVYPGLAALVPTLSGAALIASGTGSTPTVIGRVLSLAPMQWVGDLSYSLYLWHFPFLIIGASYFEPAGWMVRAALVAGAVVCAWVSYTWIENPLRRLPSLARRNWLSLALGTALVGMAWSVASAAPALAPGAPAYVINEDGQRVKLRPALWQVEDINQVKGLDCPTVFEKKTCFFGDRQSKKQIVLLGDSHAQAFGQGVKAVVEKRNWGLTVWAKAGCTVADVSLYDDVLKRRYTECDAHRKESLKRTIRAKPSAVILSSARNDRRRVYDRRTGKLLSIEASRKVIVAGWRSTVRQLTDAGLRVVVVKDWPRAPFNPPECLASKGDARECTFATSRVPDAEPIAVKGLPNVKLFSFDSEFCKNHTCSPVLGDLLVYKDTNHISYAYALHLSGRISRALDQE
jgi:peptidoglycan/LPS O-acetylase OafA/YrhL